MYMYIVAPIGKYFIIFKYTFIFYFKFDSNTNYIN